MAKSLTVLLLLVFLCGCAQYAMTRTTYDNIMVGTTFTELEERVGEPYNVQTIGYNTYEYEYVEKIPIVSGFLVENHYFLVVRDGKIISKRVQQEKSPAYNQIYQVDPNYPNYMTYPQY